MVPPPLQGIASLPTWPWSRSRSSPRGQSPRISARRRLARTSAGRRSSNLGAGKRIVGASCSVCPVRPLQLRRERFPSGLVSRLAVAELPGGGVRLGTRKAPLRIRTAEVSRRQTSPAGTRVNDPPPEELGTHRHHSRSRIAGQRTSVAKARRETCVRELTSPANRSCSAELRAAVRMRHAAATVDDSAREPGPLVLMEIA